MFDRCDDPAGRRIPRTTSKVRLRSWHTRWEPGCEDIPRCDVRRKIQPGRPESCRRPNTRKGGDSASLDVRVRAADSGIRVRKELAAATHAENTKLRRSRFP